MNVEYYKSEVNKLNLKSEYGLKIKILDGDFNSTNYLNLNKDCIEALRELLKELES